MKPEAQRIAIAEACGWKEITAQNWIPLGIPPTRRHGVEYIPSYLKDLNAMHEAEKVLTPEQLSDYASYIIRAARHKEGIEDHESHYPVPFALHATAAQRAEAFLKTLNLWEDDEYEIDPRGHEEGGAE